MTIRFGLIGCGGVSNRHYEAILAIPGATLVAVSDISTARANAVAKLTGAEACGDYQALIDRADIDVVCIVTPTGTHAELVRACARAKKHVVVEKPLATTIEDANGAVAECERAGVMLSVITQHRFDASTIRIKQAIDEGRLGRVFLVQVTVHWFRAQSYYDRSAGSGTVAMDGGGVLMIQALHTLDLATYLLGPVQTVSASMATAAHQRIEVEDTAVAVMRFRNGALGTLSATTGAYPGLSTRLELFGEKGTAIIEDDRLTRLYFREEDADVAMFGETATNLAADMANQPIDLSVAHRRQLEDVIEAIQTGRQPAVTGAEGINTLRTIRAFYQSIQENREVVVS